MGVLRAKERSPQEEAERQSEILTQIARQREDRAEAERALSRQNAARRQQLWAEQEQAADDRRMQAAAAVAQREADKKARLQEQQAEQNRIKMEEYRSAKAAFDSVKRELDALNIPHDLSTPEGLSAATDQKLRATALRELLAQADQRLIAAERGVGRHRGVI